MRTTTLTRYMIVGIVGVFVVLGLNAIFNSDDAVPEEVQQRAQEDVAAAPTATTSVESLNKISGSSDVKSDLDVYIESTETMPNPNDFNDSYSDLNR